MRTDYRYGGANADGTGTHGGKTGDWGGKVADEGGGFRVGSGNLVGFLKQVFWRQYYVAVAEV